MVRIPIRVRRALPGRDPATRPHRATGRTGPGTSARPESRSRVEGSERQIETAQGPGGTKGERRRRNRRLPSGGGASSASGRTWSRSGPSDRQLQKHSGEGKKKVCVYQDFVNVCMAENMLGSIASISDRARTSSWRPPRLP